MKLAPGSPLAIGLRFNDDDGDHAVGRVVMANQRAMLEWSGAYRSGPRRVSPLLYPAERGLIEARSREFDGLHGFLSDSLPDGWGTLLMKRRVERLDIAWDGLDAVHRLALVGEHGRGALTFIPATTPFADVDEIDLPSFAAQSRLILLGEEVTLGDSLAQLGGASGGARPKVHIRIGGDGRMRAEDGEGTPGFDSWIVKFPAIVDPIDIGPVEHAYAAMARAAGIDMAETRLLPVRDGPGYFATRRFDRPEPGRRLHMLSLAGAIEAPPHMPSVDYDGLLRATMAITRDVRDVEQGFRRMLFNVLACNRDDHSRQHAFLMDEAGVWRLAPAYDLTFSAGPGGEHYLAIAGEGRAPTRAHVDRIAKTHGIAAQRVADMIEQVIGSVSDWPRHARHAGVGASLAPIKDRLERIWRDFTAG